LPLLEQLTVFLEQFGGLILGWGWLLVLLSLLWIAWKTYLLLKAIDYLSGIQWTFLQVTVPEDNAQTPKAMENIYEVLGGLHKSPDLVELLFEGYQDAWFSCELHCQANRVRYILVIPTMHRRFVEGVVYGQYPKAEIREVEDYTQRYSHLDLEKKFDLFGVEIVPVLDDFYPIRTYAEYEDSLAEDDKYVDPHQALIEAYSNLEEGEEFWLQILVRPIDAKKINDWEEKGESEIAKIAGTAKEAEPNLLAKLLGFFIKLPGEVFSAMTQGPAELPSAKDDFKFHLYNPVEEARMKGILQKISRTGYKTKIRVLYMTPAGKFRKPAQGTAIGVFKQFNTFHMNSLKPDSLTKTSGPSYFFKLSRRRFRKRTIFLLYQWRDFWGNDSGFMLTAEELSTLYHFPVKYLRSPVVEHAAAGLGGAPENVPFV
jgi:hypothetical protein